MAGKPRYTAKQVADALSRPDVKGYASKAAEFLGCDIRTIYNYRDRYDLVAQAFIDAREKRTDAVENKLYALIEKENPAAIIFYLKTQAKDRGYVERQEITGKDGTDLNVIVKFEDMSNDDDD